jgi:two-component system chemotaxis response regulator CheB
MTSERNPSQIGVLIVDDSAFMRTALSRIVAYERDLCVVGTATTGMEALLKIAALNPDVVTLDVEMPGLNGVQTLRQIMAESPRPVIMVSSVTVEDAEITFDALAAGAFDYVPKRLSPSSLDILHIREELIAKIRAAAESGRSREKFIALRKPPRAAEPLRRQTLPSTPAVVGLPIAAPAIVALGVSTGGPKALQEILPALPGDLPVPILVVQHMPDGFVAPFAERLNNLCALSVCQASQGEIVRPGVVYIAPSGFHMTVDRPANSRTVICLSDKPRDRLHVPSVDVMMQSVASAFQSQAMGIIMTGMGSDGAQGMSAIHQAGGFTLGQDAASCAVYGMPRVCAETGILNKVVPLAQIPREILHATRYRTAGVG